MNGETAQPETQAPEAVPIVIHNARIILETIECCTCGITFAVAGTFKQQLRKTHRRFYCPNGHEQFFG